LKRPVTGTRDRKMLQPRVQTSGSVKPTACRNIEKFKVCPTKTLLTLFPLYQNVNAIMSYSEFGKCFDCSSNDHYNHLKARYEIPMRRLSRQPKMNMWVFHVAIKKQIIST
jgi:hypothetical protein